MDEDLHGTSIIESYSDQSWGNLGKFQGAVLGKWGSIFIR